jgi:hypothetical protein
MDLTINGVAMVPVVIGLVAAATGLGMPKKLAPVLAVGLGVAVGVLYVNPGDTMQGVLSGVAIGLSAVGLYSGAKNALETK